MTKIYQDLKKNLIGRLLGDVLAFLTLGAIVFFWPAMWQELIRLVSFVNSLTWNLLTPFVILLVGWMIIALDRAIEHTKTIIFPRRRISSEDREGGMKPLAKRIRVKVFDASMEKLLGEGWVIAKGIAYIFTMKVTCPKCRHEMVLLYTTPEKPSAEEIQRLGRRGITIDSDENDVMIRLDDGREVYGSSTWWQPISKEPQNGEGGAKNPG